MLTNGSIAHTSAQRRSRGRRAVQTPLRPHSRCRTAAPRIPRHPEPPRSKQRQQYTELRLWQRVKGARGRGYGASAEFPSATARAATSAIVRASRSRSNDFIPALVLPSGIIEGPVGNGHLAPILRDDMAAVAAALLLAGGHQGQTYAIAGHERFTLAEATAQLARSSGRAITFEDAPLAEAFASRAGYGAPAFEVAGWVSTCTSRGERDVSAVPRIALVGADESPPDRGGAMGRGRPTGLAPPCRARRRPATRDGGGCYHTARQPTAAWR